MVVVGRKYATLLAVLGSMVKFKAEPFGRVLLVHINGKKDA